MRSGSLKLSSRNWKTTQAFAIVHNRFYVNSRQRCSISDPIKCVWIMASCDFRNFRWEWTEMYFFTASQSIGLKASLTVKSMFAKLSYIVYWSDTKECCLNNDIVTKQTCLQLLGSVCCANKNASLWIEIVDETKKLKSSLTPNLSPSWWTSALFLTSLKRFTIFVLFHAICIHTKTQLFFNPNVTTSVIFSSPTK